MAPPPTSSLVISGSPVHKCESGNHSECLFLPLSSSRPFLPPLSFSLNVYMYLMLKHTAIKRLSENPLWNRNVLEFDGRSMKDFCTYRNLPLVRWLLSKRGSQSSREMVPWNQGIFSCAVVAISFSSWGFWLMIACSNEAPW